MIDQRAPATVTPNLLSPVISLWVLVGIAVFLGFTGIVTGAQFRDLPIGTVLEIASAVVFIWAGMRSLWTTYCLMLSGSSWSWLGTLGAFFFSGFGLLFLVVITGRGRQVRRKGQVLLPELNARSDWATLSLTPMVDPHVRAGLAAQWRENGRNEYASIAAFGHLTLELTALGAPPELLADAQRDALDEIRHAELCFSLARALDGQSRSPAPFPRGMTASELPRDRLEGLKALAASSLIEGALLEGFSARLLASMVPHCHDLATRAVLKELAADEGRHSRHGWDVALWCLNEGGAPVADALRRAATAIPSEVPTSLPAPAHNGDWERYGITGVAREAEAYRETRAHVVERIAALLSSRRAA